MSSEPNFTSESHLEQAEPDRPDRGAKLSRKLWLRLGIGVGALALGTAAVYFGIQGARPATGTESQAAPATVANQQLPSPVTVVGTEGPAAAAPVVPADLGLPAPNVVVRANDSSDQSEYQQGQSYGDTLPAQEQPYGDSAPARPSAVPLSPPQTGAPFAATASVGDGGESPSNAPQADELAYDNSTFVSDGAGQTSAAQTGISDGYPAAAPPQERGEQGISDGLAPATAQPPSSGDRGRLGQFQLNSPTADSPYRQDQQLATGNASDGFAERAAAPPGGQFPSPGGVATGGPAPAGVSIGDTPAEPEVARTASQPPNVYAEQPYAPAADLGRPAPGFNSPYAEPADVPNAQLPQARQPQFGNRQIAADPLGSVALAPLASDAPGPPELDGLQSPSVVINKSAPPEIQVGQPATFKLHVQNVGQSTAQDVIVTDAVPHGTELLGTSPQAAEGRDGKLTWQLGSLEPGQELTLSMELLPRTEGEIGSVAQVGFQTQASVRTRCTKPLLTIQHTTKERVHVGDDVVFVVTIANPGTGAARNVILEADIPDELAHEYGAELKNEIGTVEPGEELQFDLELKAQQGGIVTSTVRILGGDNLMDEHTTQLEIIAPELQVGVRGAKRRYLEREVTYEIAVSNPGTAPAKNVDLIAYLPQGLKFESADNKARYDRQSHAVAWNLEQLPPQQTGVVKLSALPMEIGDQQLVVQGRAEMDLSAEFTHTTQVQGTVELTFTIADIQDPIEVGSTTTYEVRVVNQGSQVATNVQLSAKLPPELTPSEPTGATRGEVRGQQIVMEKIARLAPQADAVYRFKATGQRAGDHLINVQLTSDDVRTPVIKQESTKVYADQ